MSISIIWNSLIGLLAFAGAGAIVLTFMLASPLGSPPPIDAIKQSALQISPEGKPDLSYFQARDGTRLAYRLYPAENGASDRLAIVVHGSSASSDAMNMIARGLAENGVAAVAIDARGHGASGTRGDIGHAGQLDDDLVDLGGALRESYPDAKLTLMGHSSGGGFALRFAAGPHGALFDRVVLLSPYLGYAAPTSRPQSEGGPHWAEVDTPRVIALGILDKLGIDWLQSLPVIAFANAPDTVKYVTLRYSYRLLADFGPPSDWKSAFQTLGGRVHVIAGDKDEFMKVALYKSLLNPLGVHVTILPDVDHIGLLYKPDALKAIVAATASRAPATSIGM
jgi:pimeloyl-ACP methyl ester carboxylesterase